MIRAFSLLLVILFIPCGTFITQTGAAETKSFHSAAAGLLLLPLFAPTCAPGAKQLDDAACPY